MIVEALLERSISSSISSEGLLEALVQGLPKTFWKCFRKPSRRLWEGLVQALHKTFRRARKVFRRHSRRIATWRYSIPTSSTSCRRWAYRFSRVLVWLMYITSAVVDIWSCYCGSCGCICVVGVCDGFLELMAYCGGAFHRLA